MAISDDVRQTRLGKLETVKKAGLNPYPEAVKRTHTLKEANDRFGGLLAEGKEIILAGRMIGLRLAGDSFLADLFDGTGKMAAVLEKSKIGPKGFDFFKDVFDEGDIIEVRGWLAEKEGEKVLEAVDYRMLAKSLKPLPEKWRGCDMDSENAAGRASGIYDGTIRIMAEFLEDKGFINAPAEGFKWFGDFFRIGEEGLMDVYWSFADCRMAMALTEEMISLAQESAGDREISFERPWGRMEYFDLFEKYAGIKYAEAGEKAIVAKAESLGIDVSGKTGKAFLADTICGKICWPELANPTFVLHGPDGSLIPAKKTEKHLEKLADCRLVIGGKEVANIFSEQNNPLELEKREKDLPGARYSDAVEYGLPPAARIIVNLEKLTSLLSSGGKGSLPSSAGGRKNHQA